MSMDEAEWLVAQSGSVDVQLQPADGGAPLSLRLDKPAATTTPSKRLQSKLFGSTAWLRLGEFTADSGAQ
eukprot:2991847-Prymnesium_polylepis.1